MLRRADVSTYRSILRSRTITCPVKLSNFLLSSKSILFPTRIFTTLSEHSLSKSSFNFSNFRLVSFGSFVTSRIYKMQSASLNSRVVNGLSWDVCSHIRRWAITFSSHGILTVFLRYSQFWLLDTVRLKPVLCVLNCSMNVFLPA